MSTWFQKFQFNPSDAAAWLGLTSENSFRVIAPNSTPNPLPKSLLDKCDAVLVMRSGSKEEDYIVGNLYRRDKGMIDQMPFGSLYISGSGSAAMLTHHGDWIGRTFSGSKSPPTYFKLSDTGSGAYDTSFATLGLPAKESGSIFELKPQSNIGAFQRVIDEIRKHRA